MFNIFHATRSFIAFTFCTYELVGVTLHKHSMVSSNLCISLETFLFLEKRYFLYLFFRFIHLFFYPESVSIIFLPNFGRLRFVNCKFFCRERISRADRVPHLSRQRSIDPRYTLDDTRSTIIVSLTVTRQCFVLNAQKLS